MNDKVFNFCMQYIQAQLTLILFKLSNLIQWDWLYILIPIILPLAALAFILLISLIQTILWQKKSQATKPKEN